MTRGLEVLKAFGKIFLFIAATTISIYVAVEKFSSDVLKLGHYPQIDSVAVIPSHWRPHQLNSQYGQGTAPEVSAHYQSVNKQGFKYHHDISETKPEKTIRVIAMGGSTLFGWGSEGLPQYGNWRHLTNRQTISYFLEEKLNQEIKKTRPDWNVEVINAAVIDYNSAFHLVYYNQTIYKYNPDIVIFLDGNNEFYGIEKFNTFESYKNTQVNIINSYNSRDKYFTYYVATRYLAQFSKMFAALQYEALNKWLSVEAPTVNRIYELPQSFENFDARYDDRAELFMRTYTQLKAAFDFDGIRTALFLGPQMLLEDQGRLNDADKKTWAQVVKDWEPTGSPGVGRIAFMKRVREKLPGYFAKLGIPYYDVATPGALHKSDAGLYIDYTHLTPSGSEVVADMMVGPMVKLVEDSIAHPRKAK